jgi:hypothetical protein
MGAGLDAPLIALRLSQKTIAFFVAGLSDSWRVVVMRLVSSYHYTLVFALVTIVDGLKMGLNIHHFSW